jgi:hypothetical protein
MGFRLSRGLSFAILCSVCAVLTASYAWLSISRSRQALRPESLPPVDSELEAPPSPTSNPPIPVVPSPEASVSAAVPRSTRASETVLLIRHTAFDQSFGLLAVDPGPMSPGRRTATRLTCERVHFRNRHGICLVAGRPLMTSYSAVFFNGSFQVGSTVPLDGIPSRARVSPNGRSAAVTVFVEGHSYADAGFSTATSVLDTETGRPVLANLEELQVFRDGLPFRQTDFNFWGVTFAADSNRFYATLGTRTTTFLLEGVLSEKTARIVLEHVDCPSLSPDNTRLAFKKPRFAQNQPAWRLYVLDLKTFIETPLAETRSVDDQVEWLDDSRILYGLSKGPDPTTSDVWVVQADGGGQPEVFLRDAASPTVVRPGPDGFDRETGRRGNSR